MGVRLGDLSSPLCDTAAGQIQTLASVCYGAGHPVTAAAMPPQTSKSNYPYAQHRPYPRARSADDLEQPELAGDIFDARTQCDKLEQSLAISEVVAVRRDGALIA